MTTPTPTTELNPLVVKNWTQEIALIDSEIVEMSRLARPLQSWLTRLNKRIENLNRRRHRVQLAECGINRLDYASKEAMFKRTASSMWDLIAMFEKLEEEKEEYDDYGPELAGDS